jgi:hypothetical protein
MAGLGQRAVTKSVMAGLGPAIHVLLVAHPKDVDARAKPGHDGESIAGHDEKSFRSHACGG